eukprot:11126978-Alexandrium_andersonii.AAC.1
MDALHAGAHQRRKPLPAIVHLEQRARGLLHDPHCVVENHRQQNWQGHSRHLDVCPRDNLLGVWACQ